MKIEKGITLIALIITIILMLILAGVVISLTIGENGIFETAKYAVQKNSEAEAKEKLELTLADLTAYKYTDEAYNENEYINKYLKNEGMVVIDNVVTVDNWNFEIDRGIPAIKATLGASEIKLTKEVKEYLGKNENDKYMVAVLVKIESNTQIESIEFENTDGTILTVTIENQILTKDMQIELDREYKITVKMANGKTENRTIIESSVENIRTSEELAEFRDKVNSGLTYEGKTIQVLKNIDLEGNAENKWEPIGNSQNLFKGSFNGNNKKIKNLYIDSTNDCQGLFGNALNAKFNNIILDDITIKGRECVAGILGCGENVTVEECGISSSTISSISATVNSCGGIVGKINNGTITKCYNHSNVTLNTSELVCYVGGIIGYGENINISYCYNTKNISGTGYPSVKPGITVYGVRVGGIVGNASNGFIIKNCYNFGKITSSGYGTEPGGIAGCSNNVNGPSNSGYIKNCFNVGQIISYGSGFNRQANITAWTGGTHISNCYYIANNIYGYNSTHSYSTFSNNTLTTADNIKNVAINILGGDNNIWIKSEDNNGYPILKWQLEVK